MTFLQKKFKVVNEDGLEYNIEACAAPNDEDLFNCHYVNHPVLGTGCVAFTQTVIRNRLTSGRWRLVASKEDTFQQRIDFFQVHIDAVEENLESLKDAFQVLKNSVVQQ